jgi:hypothetical protein
MELFADDMAVVPTSLNPYLLFTYIWRLTSVDFITGYRTGRLLLTFQKTQRRSLLRPRHGPKGWEQSIYSESSHRVETVRHLGMILDTRPSWTAINRVRRKVEKRLGMLALLNRRRDLSIRNGVLNDEQLSVPAPPESMLTTAMSGSCKCWNRRVFALRLTHPGSLLIGNLNINEFRFSPTTSKHQVRTSTES